jgi:hypothetical protein
MYGVCYYRFDNSIWFFMDTKNNKLGLDQSILFIWINSIVDSHSQEDFEITNTYQVIYINDL